MTTPSAGRRAAALGPLRAATVEDLPAALGAYDAVLTHLETTTNYPLWKRGVYPAPADVERWIAGGELFLLEAGGAVVGVEVLNHVSGAGADSPWLVEAEGEDALYIHTLAVVPAALGTGVGSRLVDGAVEVARSRDCRTVRLDVVPTNTPAIALYRRCGFTDLGTHRVVYEGTDLDVFTLMELPL